MRRRRLLRRLFIAALLTVAVCEAALRAFAATLPAATVDPTLKAARSNPAMYQYRNSPYWSLEFVQSMGKIIHYRELDENGQWYTKDLSLPGYTITNNERLTTDQPAAPVRDVWVFGSSTVLGAYVADGWTIASYLQRELNAHGVAWRVRNYGQPGIDVSGQYYWLTQVDVKRGDIVIFIDGAVELAFAMDRAKREQLETMPVCQLAERMPLALLRFGCISATMSLSDEDAMRQIRPAFKRYWGYLDKAQAYTVARGAAWLHFVQPAPGVYGELYATIGRGDTVLEVDSADYFDSMHYSDAGHAAIARRIVAALLW